MTNQTGRGKARAAPHASHQRQRCCSSVVLLGRKELRQNTPSNKPVKGSYRAKCTPITDTMPHKFNYCTNKPTNQKGLRRTHGLTDKGDIYGIGAFTRH